MSAPPTQSARASLAIALAAAEVMLALTAALAIGAHSDAIAATAAVALLVVACGGEAVHHRHRRGGRHG
jgi:hypothetical protein